MKTMTEQNKPALTIKRKRPLGLNGGSGTTHLSYRMPNRLYNRIMLLSSETGYTFSEVLTKVLEHIVPLVEVED